MSLSSAYSADAVYLYSTKDDVREGKGHESSIVPPSKKARSKSPSPRIPGSSVPDETMEEDISAFEAESSLQIGRAHV